MKILILGHTGFLGKNVHKYLKSSASNQLACISSADLDLTSSDSHKYLRNYLDSQDVVIFCSGIKELCFVNSFFCSDCANRTVGNINIVIKKSLMVIFYMLELTATN